MSQVDVNTWVEKSSSSESLLFERQTGDSTDSLAAKSSSDNVSNVDSNENKSYDTSSTRSSEDDKKLQKHKKDILHRDIEKRRRDRINSSLTELRDLVPSAKLKLKNDGSNRTGRLQKARLLELTVEYLKSIKPNSRKEEIRPTNNKEDLQNALITESAQQIYVQAYKSGFSEAVKEITKTLPPHKSKEGISAQIDSISVPSIFLLSENGRGKEDTGNLTMEDGKLIKGNTKTVNETFSSSYEQATVIRDHKRVPDFGGAARYRSSSVDENSIKSFYEKNLFCGNTDLVNGNKNYPSPDTRSFSERSPVLISSYVLSEDKTRYQPTVLPLNVILEEALKHASINKATTDMPTITEKPQVGLKRPIQMNDYCSEKRNKIFQGENQSLSRSSVNEEDLNFLKNIHSVSKEELLKFQTDLRNRFY